MYVCPVAKIKLGAEHMNGENTSKSWRKAQSLKSPSFTILQGEDI
jgi:hypothetical protein